MEALEMTSGDGWMYGVRGCARGLQLGLQLDDTTNKQIRGHLAIVICYCWLTTVTSRGEASDKVSQRPVSLYSPIGKDVWHVRRMRHASTIVTRCMMHSMVLLVTNSYFGSVCFFSFFFFFFS
jgi:hypothetical protein